MGGAPAGILTRMPTTADNRGPGLDSGWLRYDDGHCYQAGRDGRDRKEFITSFVDVLPPFGRKPEQLDDGPGGEEISTLYIA